MGYDKIIFLDFDGVLNVIPTKHDDFGAIFHVEFVLNLKEIIEETGAKIVISSSWRSDGLEKLRRMWEHRKYPGEIVDVTPSTVAAGKRYDIPYDLVKRGDEIRLWLENNKVNKFVIIDDDNDICEYRDNFVYCVNPEHEDCVDIGYGLTKQCAKWVMQKLAN